MNSLLLLNNDWSARSTPVVTFKQGKLQISCHGQLLLEIGNNWVRFVNFEFGRQARLEPTRWVDEIDEQAVLQDKAALGLVFGIGQRDIMWTCTIVSRRSTAFHDVGLLKLSSGIGRLELSYPLEEKAHIDAVLREAKRSFIK